MKRIKTFAILLVFLLILPSCSKTKAVSYYDLAIEAQQNLNSEQAKNYILLYMLTYDESKQNSRDDAVVLYTSFDFPASLNTALLKPSDCMEGKITLYKSYAELGQINAANEILESKIHGYLPSKDYARLVVNYPTDSLYTAAVLKQWSQMIKEEDKTDFLNLFLKFVSSDMSEKTAKTSLEIAENLMNDEFYKRDNALFADVYKSMAILLDKLYDTYNSSRYWKMVKILNPEDEEAELR